MKEKASRLAVLTKGIIKENPNLVLLLGTCPTLATTSSAFNGMGMGIAATAVLICSNIAISLLAKIIPDKVRIPCYIVLIAGFVTLVQFIVQAFAEPLYNSLGVFLPLIVVNCIILGRAEMFANKNGVLDSALDGIGMGLYSVFDFHRSHKRNNRSGNYLLRFLPRRRRACSEAYHFYSVHIRASYAYHSSCPGRILRVRLCYRDSEQNTSVKG